MSKEVDIVKTKIWPFLNKTEFGIFQPQAPGNPDLAHLFGDGRGHSVGVLLDPGVEAQEVLDVGRVPADGAGGGAGGGNGGHPDLKEGGNADASAESWGTAVMGNYFLF